MKFKGFGLVVLAGILVAGCSNTNLRVVKPVYSPPKRVNLALIDKSNSNELEAEVLGLKRTLILELQDEGIEVTDIKKEVALLTGEFRYYDSGNRALRAFVGFGAGRAAYDSKWKLISAAGEEIGNCTIDGWRAMGVFGGSLTSVHEDMAEALADCVKGNN